MEAGYKNIDVVLDQLNTHWSVELVQVVARLCGLPKPPAAAIKKGPQRRVWLEDHKLARPYKLNTWKIAA